MSSVLKPGVRFAGRYVIDELIAEGGMASIYRGRDEREQRLVAVKVLYPYYADNRVIRARFAEEGRIQQLLRHPNVVSVYEVLEDPLSIVMEHVDGPTLDDYLAEQGQLEESDVLDIAVPIMSALGLAHSRGIIHRDLKPSNILLLKTADGFHPKVMDFGVAKVKDAKHDLTATGTTVGTLHYMSPEQIVGSKNIDGRADIYSLGVTLYKLVTGEVPFNAPTEFALMMAQVEAPPLPPSKLRPDLAPALERVILRAMAKKPVDRFQSIRELTMALLAMRRGGAEGTVGDTITTTISQELIDMAMAADEIAQDRTSEMNLRVIRTGSLDSTPDASGEATIEIAASRTPRPEPVTEEETREDSTVELSSSQIIRMATVDQTAERVFQGEEASTAPTSVLERKIDAQGRRLDDSSQNITRPSRPSTPLNAKLPSPDSIDTESIERRIHAPSDRVVVLDVDANSRDMTAPKITEKDYQSAINQGRPSGPKVVMGYNPADTEDRTFEKPNFRTRLPQFETAKSNDFDLEEMRAEQPAPPPPQRRGRSEQPAVPSAAPPAAPPRPGPPPGPKHRAAAPKRATASNPSSMIERVDVIAQSALRSAADHNVPPWMVLALIVAGIAILMSIVIALGLLVIG